MKKKVILSSLLFAMVVNADNYNYEITPVVGYLWNSTSDKMNIIEDGSTGGIDNHPIFGAEIQKNNVCGNIKPEMTFLYGRKRADNKDSKTNIVTAMANGVVEFNTNSVIKPFIKAGLGYEWYINTHPNEYDGLITDAGLGFKTDLTKNIAFKVEGLYWYKMNDSSINGNKGTVHNLSMLAGITYSFDKKNEPVMLMNKLTPIESVKPTVMIQPKTNLEVMSTPLKNDKVAVLDSDKDGILDLNDKCPNTPIGFKVDMDGCPLKATLHLNFEISSNEVDKNGQVQIAEFADFLKNNIAYKATIVGHTDSTASDEYNQRLSEQRAEKVKMMLMKQGIASSRLVALGKGESMPLFSNKTKEGRAQNRRIEVELSH